MKTAKPVEFGLVGIGHYARSYVERLIQMEQEGIAHLGSVVIRLMGEFPESEQLLEGRNIRIRATLEEMLQKDNDLIEVVALPVGIDSHKYLTIMAANAGFNVLVEKPSTATVQDLDEMEAALARNKVFCAVGFQCLYQDTVLALKEEIVKGSLGKIEAVTVEGLWQRDDNYYTRTEWAGRLMYRGTHILDGTINNPMAHYLFNALFFASTERGKAAVPQAIRAELYHGHKIEAEDTSALEIECPNGTRVYFFGSLCAEEENLIRITVHGEKGRAVWGILDDVQIYEGDKLVRTIPSKDKAPHLEIFRNVSRYLRGEEKALKCPIQATRPHVMAVNGAYESSGLPRQVASEHLRFWEHPKHPGARMTSIVGIDELVHRAARERKLFSDLGAPWAAPSKPFSMKGYKEFKLPTA